MNKGRFIAAITNASNLYMEIKIKSTIRNACTINRIMRIAFTLYRPSLVTREKWRSAASSFQSYQENKTRLIRAVTAKLKINKISGVERDTVVNDIAGRTIPAVYKNDTTNSLKMISRCSNQRYNKTITDNPIPQYRIGLRTKQTNKRSNKIAVKRVISNSLKLF